MVQGACVESLLPSPVGVGHRGISCHPDDLCPPVPAGEPGASAGGGEAAGLRQVLLQLPLKRGGL